MRLRKLILATVGATVLLGALVGSASARNISLSNQFIETQWRAVTFTGPFSTRIVCEVHLSGSLHRRTLAKSVGSLIGYITQAEFGNNACSTGRATILRETLPWHVRYLGFVGTLPNITRIIVNVIRASFFVEDGGLVECLAASTVTRPATGTFDRNVATRILTTATIGGTIPCDGINGILSSEAAQVFLLGTTNRITVTLI
jgi:hypothetical protein